MINITAAVISIFYSLCVYGIIIYRNNNLKDDSKKIDNTSIVFVIIGSLVVSYLLAHLITSNDENKILMNNIKTGEPPF
jgi:amino acid transporter